MLFENMNMAFSAIRVNKMRSFLTMLGIIIGIGSVISIVSIGDTMRNLFADLYKGKARGTVFDGFRHGAPPLFCGSSAIIPGGRGFVILFLAPPAVFIPAPIPARGPDRGGEIFKLTGFTLAF